MSGPPPERTYSVWAHDLHGHGSEPFPPLGDDRGADDRADGEPADVVRGSVTGGRHRATDRQPAPAEPALLLPYPRDPEPEPWAAFDIGSLGTTTLRMVERYEPLMNAARHAVDWLAAR
jgi:hypothetical protein